MMPTRTYHRAATASAFAVALAMGTWWSQAAHTQSREFHVEEATIAELHTAIQNGQTSCRAVVQAYLDRAKAYNGTCTSLVTKNAGSIAPATGPVRSGAPVTYPTTTVAASAILPDLDQYTGPPIEFGRMESTISDPSVQEQFGMRVGIPDAGQLNALTTLNMRGERSVTCKAECDLPPSAGPLPASCPSVCEDFRKQPDALERATELDAQYGRKPDLNKMPMYCVPFAWKTWYDAKDMRATGGNDVNYAMDVPKEDSPDVADLRGKGAISFAVANANSTGGPTVRDGPEKPRSITPDGNYAYGLWGGQPCNPYDTTRVPRGTSSGSGVSVSANLVMCSICEQTSASCKGPASRNNVVNLLATKGVMMDGGPGYANPGDRAGIMCRTVADAVQVLDAAKGYQSRDMYTAIPKGLMPKEPYASFLVGDRDVKNKPLKGLRVGVVREFMVKHTKNDVAISDQIDNEIKTVLRDTLGAELVESVDPLYPDDPAVPNMKYTFQDAFAEILPQALPQYFWQKTPAGDLEFGVPGWDVRTLDYGLALALGRAPLSPKLNLRRISSGLANPRSSFMLDKYLQQRGDTRIKDWASWIANAKWKDDATRAGADNYLAAHVTDMRPAADTIGYAEMQAVFRMVVQRVMNENGIDAFVNPENTLPPYRIGYPADPAVNDRPAISCCTAFTALLGGPEAEVPAGYTTTAYEPRFALNADKNSYVATPGSVETTLPHPMPISLMVWAAPGSDASVIRVASAYEAASHHRKPPSAFGPLPVVAGKSASGK
jgi:Asp-tRNA(Asn)/Glu-tRNA(Gln) amidotransferase A subunit family amidase